MTRYVPILRTKSAEWTALRELTDDVRQMIMPCLELLPQELTRSGGDTARNLPHAVCQFARRIRRNWGRRLILIDGVHLTTSVRRDTLTLLAQAASAYDIAPVWTFSLHDDAAVYTAARHGVARPYALRIDYGEFDKDDIGERIDQALTTWARRLRKRVW